jgi:putative glutamine amidotransferase
MFCAVWGLSKNDQPYVYSAHHQQIEKLGHGLRVIATSLDGKVVEAVEHDRYRNVLGVQFHPEAGDLFDTTFRTRFTPDDPAPSSLLSFLKSHPPSSAFHQKIWAWLSRALVD